MFRCFYRCLPIIFCFADTSIDSQDEPVANPHRSILNEPQEAQGGLLFPKITESYSQFGGNLRKFGRHHQRLSV